MKKTLMLFLIISIWSCTNNKKGQSDNGLPIIKMNFDETTSIHDVGLIDSIDILRLDNRVIFGRVNKVVRDNNRLYLLDAFMTNSVIVYDTEGNFIKQIINVGQGPEEYLQLTDIFIDKRENALTLVSRLDKKLMKYDLDNLNLLSIEKTPKSFFSFINMRDGYVGYMNNLITEKPFNLWTMSQSLELTNGFFEIPLSWDSNSSGTISTFSTYKDGVYYIQPRDFNIYTINENKVDVAHSFDLGENIWPSKVREYEEVMKIRENSPNRYIEDLYMFQESQNHLIIRTVFKGQDLLGIYDKRSKKSHVAELKPYTDKYFIPFGEIVGVDENAIYTLVEAKRVKRNITGKDDYNDFESMYPVQVKNLREKFKDVTIDEFDNPFLLIHYFDVK